MTLENPLVLTTSLATPIIPASDHQRLLYLLLEIGGGEGSEALPVNLGLVIDTSDSMRIMLVTNEQFTQMAQTGEAQEVITDGVPAFQITTDPGKPLGTYPRRIDYVAEALVVASEFLRPQDHYSLVAFAGEALTLIPVSSGKERNRLIDTARELDFLQIGDETHMDQGLALAIDQLQRRQDHLHSNRLILLTDGHTRNVNQCYEMAKNARSLGQTLTTMGIGVEFNEDLLIPLADMTGGNAYYIETPEQLPTAFRRELGRAFGVSYRKVEIHLTVPHGVTLRKIHRVLPKLGIFEHEPGEQGNHLLHIGNYDPMNPVALLLELVIPPWGPGTYRIAKTLLGWEDPLQEYTRPYDRQNVTIKIDAAQNIQYNHRVMNIVEKVGAYKMGTIALDAVRTADRSTASRQLRQAATQLHRLGELDLAEEMANQADALERDGEMNPFTTKRLRYETRRLTQKLSG